MASIEVEYFVIAKDRNGQAIYHKGMCKVFRIEESLIDVFGNLYRGILDEFVLRKLGKDSDELEHLKQYSVILENFKFEWD